MDAAAPIERVIALAGGQSALARRLQISPQAVQQWVSRGRIPANRVLAIERAVDGAITRYELRPDVFGDDRPLPRGS